MSGDVQPRKRKDKKKQKDDDGYSTPNDDVNIHVHKEGVLVGLIIKENQGLTELEEVESESRYSQIFEGWIDKTVDDEHEDDHSPEFSHEHDLDEEDDEHYQSEEDNIEESEEQSEEVDNDDVDQDEDEDSTTRSEEETNEETEEDDQVPESEEDNTVEEDDTEEDELSESQEKNKSESEEVDDNVSEADKDDADDDSKEEQSVEENEKVSEDRLGDESDEDKIADKSEEDVDEPGLKKDASKETVKAVKEEPIEKEGKEEILKEAPAGKEQDEKVESEPAKPSSGQVNVGEEVESDSDKEDYEHTNITNKDDLKIKDDIDAAQDKLNKNAAYANTMFDALLAEHPLSPRTLYGKAKSLDILAEEKRSNELLQQALDYYTKTLNAPDVPDPLFVLVAERYIDRARFIGQYTKAVAVHWLLIERFPDNSTYLNNLAVTYLTINLIDEARSVLRRVLSRWPNDGFALVHYGFILKTADNNLEESVHYMVQGLKTREPGVVDGRFYFHLGDALARLNRNEEAVKLYEEGVQEKVFLSKYQRSLYNVPRLTGKPWWEPADLPSYQKLFSALKDNWNDIRKEGVSVLNDQGYFRDEAENLKDTGTWKQLELFARGQKFAKNCAKSPVTCGIIQNFPNARSCRRGQTKFSVMHPGTHVWPHCGPTNCRLRIHLGLKVPPNTFIRVADETRSWKEGDIIIFDDSFEHEVWHNGSDFRLVLIIDVWHPELTPSEKKSLSPI